MVSIKITILLALCDLKLCYLSVWFLACVQVWITLFDPQISRYKLERMEYPHWALFQKLQNEFLLLRHQMVVFECRPLYFPSNAHLFSFDCSENTPKTLYQKRWHLNIRCLLLDPFSPNRCITASKQCCIKVHDIETQQRTMHCKKMEDSSPYSALISIADHRWVTGDDNGFVKVIPVVSFYKQ